MLVLDGTVTGNRESLETRGTLNGNGLAYGDNKALDLDSTYTVTVPQPGLRQRQGRGESPSRPFVEIGGVRSTRSRNDDVRRRKRLEFETTMQQRGRSLAATGTADLSSRSS